MDLRPGFSLITAPRFPPRGDWADRLRVNGGIEREGTRVHPRTDWRRPTADELALLAREHARRGAASHPASPSEPVETGAPEHSGEPCLRPGEAGLLAIPAHLREAWWACAGGGDLPLAPDEGYRRFVAAVLEFLCFKRLPLAARCEADVLASRPGLRGNRVDPAMGTLLGLSFEAPKAAPTAGVINLGDEPTHLVLLNLPAPLMRALLAGEGDRGAWSLRPPDLAARFFAAHPTYPLTRVVLDPGEGLWFPRADVVYDGSTEGKREVDIVLVIRGEVETSREPPRAATLRARS